MSFQLPDEGAASAELARQTHAWWLAAAEKAEIDVAGFDPDAPLNEQITWALGLGPNTQQSAINSTESVPGCER